MVCFIARLYFGRESKASLVAAGRLPYVRHFDMAKRNQRKLAELSRSPAFLVKACLILVALSLVVSAAVATLFPAAKSLIGSGGKDLSLLKMGADLDPDMNAAQLASVIRNRKATFLGAPPRDYRSVDFSQSASRDNKTAQSYGLIKNRIESSTAISEGERERLMLLLEALLRSGKPREEAIRRLREIPAEKRYRNEFLGDASLAMEKPAEAATFYAEEGKRFPGEAAYSQRSAVFALLEREEAGPLRDLFSMRAFRGALSPRERIEVYALLNQPAGIFLDVFRMDWGEIGTVHAASALLTASIWFSILVILGGFRKRGELGWGLLAFFLGMISTTLTLYFVYVQEELRNFVHNPQDSLINQLIHMIAGIGLREELLKLLCFAPLAFFLSRRRDPNLALICAGLTGLGFAMMENIGYFERAQDQFVAWGRLLSANAMHFCLTGVVGFSLFQLICRRGRNWDQFLFDFLLVVAIHGIYDGLIMVPQLQPYGPLNIIIIAGVAYYYFGLVRENMPREGRLRRISPLGIFVLGTALLACGTMVISSAESGFLFSLGTFAETLAGSLAVAFAFISRLRDL